MDFKVTVAGGITVKQLSFFSGLPVSLQITGRAFTKLPIRL